MRTCKKLISCLIAFALIFSWIPIETYAFTANDTNAFQLVGGSVEYSADQSKPVEVKFIGTSDDSYKGLQGIFATQVENSQIALSQMTTLYTVVADNPNYEANAQTGAFKFKDSSSPLSSVTGQAIITATYTVPAGTAPGDYVVSMELTQAIDNTGAFGNQIKDATYTATITVTPASVSEETSDYEIWYELDSTADDTLTKNYKDYQYDTTEGATNQVKAEIFLKSTKADVTVQAYDIYLSHNTKLTYSGENTMAGAVYKTVDAENKIAAAKGDQVSHIQLVKDSGKTISLMAGTAQSLGTIVFDIASNAIYDEDLEITLKVAADTENAAKTADVTNISLATTTGGQVASFYPMNIGTDLGAEVVTTYTATYDADNGTQATIQTVGRNQTATQPANPEKAGYKFAGWYNGETEFDFSTLITKNIELIAKWNEATAEYTVEHWQQNVEGADYVKVEADTETKDGQTGAQTAAEAKDYDGFTAKTITQKEIAADGSTVVKVYYDRNSYELTWNDGTNETKSEVKFGATIEVPAAPKKEGYDFTGWDLNSDNAVDEIPATMPSNGLTATAIWTPVSYTVIYNSNTGSGTMTDSTFTYDAADQKLAANTFTKTGYTFNGWNTKTDGKGTSYDDQNTVGNDWYTTHGEAVTLYAQWNPNEYTVVFDPDGGTGTMANQKFTYDTAAKLTKNAFTKTDANYKYTFAGWKNNVTGTLYSDEQEVINLATSGTVTLTAQWTTNYVVSTYATAGQGTVTAQPNTAAAGKTITVTVETEDGYQIDKVTYTEDGGTEAIRISMNGNTGTFTMPAANVSVNATFTAIPYDVTVTNPTDGTGTITATGTTDGKATVGQVITLSNDPKPGYELDKYIVNGITVDGNTFTMPASDVAVTATFKVIEYTITYDLAGGAVATENPTTYNVTTEDFTLNNPTKVGYTFAGWTGSNGTTAQTAVTITKGTTGNLTYTANWTAAEVTYTVNHWQQKLNAADDQIASNYDCVATEELKAYTGNEITPDRKSYEGFTAPEGQTVTIAANGSTVVNYYYTRNEYTISANANDSSYGTVTAPTTAEYGSTVTLTNTPNNGYKFVNYNATYEVTQDGQEVNQPVTVVEDGTFTMPAGNVTVTANFDVITYKITLDPNGGTVDPTEVSYNIKDGGTLPTPSNGLFTFQGWKVTTAAGNWEIQENVSIAAGAFSNRYGGEENAVLTAQWTFMEHDIEDYKYAYNPDANNLTDGYKLLRVKDNFGEQTGMEYKFGEESMYYTTDTNYLIDSTKDSGVFFLLIEEKYVGTDNRLNANGEALLSSGTATSGRATLIAAGENKWDINGDSVVNIADANVVYQMTLSGGSYYSDGENGGQLDNKHRLMADLVTARNDQGNDHRASIKDVNAIVNQINGVVETTNP